MIMSIPKGRKFSYDGASAAQPCLHDHDQAHAQQEAETCSHQLDCSGAPQAQMGVKVLGLL